VTSFFRDSSAFEFLVNEVIPDLVHRHSLDRPLRVWVAGCSTGEETYSLAMLFLEEIAAAKRNIKLQVFASDVDEEAVALVREGGGLRRGGSETVGRLDDRFEPVSKAQRIYRQIGRSRPGEVDFPIGPGGAARTLWPGRTSAASAQPISARDLTQRVLLETYAPASVLINRKHECLYYSGPADRYLRVASGEPSRDLLAMAREGLRSKLRVAIQQASRERVPTIATGVQASYGDSGVSVRIEVHPVRREGEELLLVSFL